VTERLADYDYHLPSDRIAQVPLADRGASRLLVLDREDGAVRHRQFADLADLLRPGDLLVRNNTRVTAMRLFGKKPSGGAVETLLLRPSTDPGGFIALVRPGRRLPPGARIEFAPGLGATVGEVYPDGQRELVFDRPYEGLVARLHDQATAPLPPYIHEPLLDRERYQTVYARHGGSAAAPTAGLHFTTEGLAHLTERGVQFAEVTLHVGLDTFRPVTHETTDDHVMHGETCAVPAETAAAVAACRGRIIAVGTTSARTLESMATGHRQLAVGAKETRIFITPGYRWQVVDGLLTNFHMPRTTMLLMVAALCGRGPLMQAYHSAIEEGYRFLSFGDAMMINPK